MIDSFNAAIALIGRGKLHANDYKYLLDGIRRIKGHIFGNYDVGSAEKQACRVAYLIANILADKKDFIQIIDANPYVDKIITNPVYERLNKIKKTGLLDFAYIYEAVKLFEVSLSKKRS